MKKFLFFVLLVPVFFSSCRKKEIDKIDGPSLNNLYGAFTVLTPFETSRDSVDFAGGENVYFTAQFSKSLDWEIKITGQSSGAVKYITGFGSSISQNTSSWIGEITEFPVFRSELCAIELTFPSEPDTLTAQVKILTPKLNAGFLISDFETGMNAGWQTFIQAGADMDFQIKTDAFSPEKNAYLNMAGTVDWDYLIGYIYFKALAYGAPHYPITSNPDNAYFNVMAYAEPGTINSIILFQFQEDDNGNGSHSSLTEDMYSMEVPVTWEGWKLISVKYSDIPCLVNGQPAAPNGNGIYNSDKIVSVNMLHLANPANGFAKMKVDYMIFTENGALKP